MKLEYWLNKLRNKTIWDWEVVYREAKDFQVIKTCGECKHWGDHYFGTLNQIEVRGCDKLDIVQPPNQRFGSTPPKNFGCIHFEPNE